MSTAGSVDDGKSTLIGRLLFDTNSLPEDHLSAVQRADGPDLAALSDGLRAEQEQGITIDVAYRYFSSARRNFILADSPGHERYTRNMVTGTSNADLTLLLVDARRGLRDQTRRHARIASMLGVKHLVAAVNKMDLVDYSSQRFRFLEEDLLRVGEKLGTSVVVIPVCAKWGDNVVHRSDWMSWYIGPTLMDHLDNVDIRSSLFHGKRLRMPVQSVTRPYGGQQRRYLGRVASGSMEVDDEVLVLPAGIRTRVTAVHALDQDRRVAVSPLSVSVELGDDADISRGDVLVSPEERPTVTREVSSQVCWMHETPLAEGATVLLKHTTRIVRAQIVSIAEVLDPSTLDYSIGAGQLRLNDIATVTLRTGIDLVVDSYAENRDMGSFVLIDEGTSDTLAAGVIVSAKPKLELAADVTGSGSPVWRPSPGVRPKGAAIWVYAADKGDVVDLPQLAKKLEFELRSRGRHTYLVDHDNIKAGLTADLTSSPVDNREELRRLAHLAALMADAGVVFIALSEDSEAAVACMRQMPLPSMATVTPISPDPTAFAAAISQVLNHLGSD